MQTPSFKLKQLRTLGVILACGALAVGCAGNSVSPMDQETGPVATTTESDAPVAASDAKPTDPNIEDATTPVADENQTAMVDTSAVSTETSPAPDSEVTPAVQQPEQMTFYFGFNKTSLDDQDKAILQEHARFLKANPSLTLEINGHTDNKGPHQYNEFLSKLRAESVAKVLIDEGITRSQLVIHALADDKPLADASDPGKNRRVELQYDEMNMLSSK